ncbi:response regulator transcription factor [Paenibacillus sp. Marseille-Q4541]|uniref:response regulator transcription factor n=1 Tax=Paenibacillus sp. Marseille-Q4541 TaxID=2831522 RepID=UPI001BA5C404|nr:response regulator transcription factor [Paenibacillus sp. Marseille-Q4541]
MYTVLIVDDEPTIREGLKTIINWEEQGYKVLDTASNGREAIDKHHQLNPHLTILDIRMPGLNGLEVIEHLRREGKKGQFLILSGHADFDYAKKAISYGVGGYLLKPVDEEEMVEELGRIKGLLDKEQNLKQRSTNEDFFYREHVIESILFGGQVWPREDVIEYGLDWPLYQVVLLEVYSESHSHMRAEVKREMAELLASSKQGIVFTAGQYIGCLLKQPLVSDEERHRFYDEMALVLKRFSSPVYMAGGSCVLYIQDIEASYNEALHIMENRFFFTEPSVVTMQATSEPSSNEVVGPLRLDEDKLTDTLYYALDIRSKDLLSRVLDDMERVMIQGFYTEHDIKKKITKIAAVALNKLSLHSTESKLIATEHTAMLSSLYQQPTLTALLETLHLQFAKLIQQLGVNSKDTIIKQMIDFIKRNPGDHLKLEVLAEVFNYNSSYLGKLFKNYTGESFNVFLDKVRMEKAKSLLEEGLKVHQVSAQIGYANVDYFHSKFKKYIGISPSAYRDQYKERQ